jgi:hypothetical protein
LVEHAVSVPVAVFPRGGFAVEELRTLQDLDDVELVEFAVTVGVARNRFGETFSYQTISRRPSHVDASSVRNVTAFCCVDVVVMWDEPDRAPN